MENNLSDEMYDKIRKDGMRTKNYRLMGIPSIADFLITISGLILLFNGKLIGLPIFITCFIIGAFVLGRITNKMLDKHLKQVLKESKEYKELKTFESVYL